MEEENHFYKEFVFNLKMEENHVMEKQSKKDLVTLNHVNYLLELKELKNNQMTFHLLLKTKKLVLDHKEMRHVKSLKEI